MLTLLEIPGKGQIIADSGKISSFHIRNEKDLSIVETINHDFGNFFTGVIKDETTALLGFGK